MSKIMLVNVTHVEESRVAVLDEGVLSAYEIETINRTHLKGNIHNAVVESVHPSLEAAFLKITPETNGFLPLDAVNFRLLPPRSESRKSGKIGQHLHPGQKILAQVVREPFAGKPPTVSTYFSLPGRFLVLMPGVDSAGVSRKIEDSKQRDRLKKLLDELKPPEGFGMIVRTAGLGQTKVELQRDLRYLLRLWESIQRASKTTEFPGIVYREADLVIRTIRDHLTSEIREVWIDSEHTYQRALEFVSDVMPSRAKTLKLYTGDRPLFNKFNLEEQIEKIYKRRVPLPAGGEIVIDGTEALTAIDVNSARSKRQGDLEDTLLQTNVEAAGEIARQMRLRDLGGLVVIDFIDMASTRNKKKVEKAMRDAMKGDRARYDVTPISKLGLMEMARQRIKGTKMAASYATCVTCDGYGLIKNVETAALAALRKLQTRTSRGDVGRLRMALPPEVATWLMNHKREELLRLERRQQILVDVQPKASLLRHDCEFEAFPREKGEETTPAAPAAATLGATQARLPDPVAPEETSERKAETRRRGRRRRSPAADAHQARDGGNGGERPAEPRKGGDEPADKATQNGEAGDRADKVVPFAPPATEEEQATAETAEESNGRRRRRRRRRRGRGSGEAPKPESGARETVKAPARDAPPVVVPRGVHSDELMPAASGSTDQAKRRRSSGSSSRRKKKSSSRGPRRDRAAVATDESED